MSLFRSRRRLVNRRRRHGWLTIRGRIFFIAAVAIALLALVGSSHQWIARQPFEVDSNAQPIGVASAPQPQPQPQRPLPAPPVLEVASDGPSAVEDPVPGEVVEVANVHDLPAVSSAPPESSALATEPLLPARPATEAPFFDPPRTRERFEASRNQPGMLDPAVPARLAEWRDPAEGDVLVATPGRVRVEYSMDEKLTEDVFKILRRGRVGQGHIIVLDPRSGKLLTYASTDEDKLPAHKAYPAASIVKILTASAVLETQPGDAVNCVYRGNKYRLNRRRLDPPRSGHDASLEMALATSNNQCFARWALHLVGEPRLRETFKRFGWLSRPAPGHDAGRLEPVETDLDLGRLGSGLDGVFVTPLHVAQIASILTTGEWIEPWWIDRVVDAFGRPLRIASRRPNRKVLESETADRLRSMMVATTKRGTAKSAFRDRRGRPRVGAINVAGKTGNLTGWDPYGRYEWFLGLAPAEDPTIAVVVLQLQGHMWWRRSSELGSDVLKAIFCDRGGCRTELAERLGREEERWPLPMLISDLSRSPNG